MLVCAVINSTFEEIKNTKLKNDQIFPVQIKNIEFGEILKYYLLNTVIRFISVCIFSIVFRLHF